MFAKTVMNISPRRRGVWLALCLLTLPVASAHAQASESDAVELKFASFFKQPIGPRGLEFGDALRAADGRRVRLVGYMVAQEQPIEGRFMLTPRPVRLSEHADGEADDLPASTVTVLLDEHQVNRVITHQPGLVALVGRLQVGRAEDASGRVSWVRLLLDPQALAEGHQPPSPNHTSSLR